MSGSLSTLLDTPSPEANRRPNVAPVRFWTEYRPDPNNPGQIVGRDMVRWSRRGDLTSSAIDEPVARVARPLAESDDTGSPMPNPKWVAIEPAYRRWKAGEEVATSGTPLEAWPAVAKGQLAALKASGIRSVEDLGSLPDGDLERIRLPDARRLRDLAKAFVANAGGIAQVEALMHQRDSQTQQLEAEVAELRAMVQAQREMAAAPQPALAEQPKPRGR
jgi:hypothetical protein